jgi:hypothetical protein
MAFSYMFEQLKFDVYDNLIKWHLKCLIWSLNLNLGFKPTSFKLLLVALAQIIACCHVMIMHHIVALHWLCSSLFAGNCPLLVDDVLTMRSMTPMKSYNIFRSARQATPLIISIQTHLLASALFYCIRITMIQLLHAAVVEPLSSAWPVIATVNRWNPLAWVGVVWALMCLLIHSCLSCLLLLRVVLGLIHREWIGKLWTCLTAES